MKKTRYITRLTLVLLCAGLLGTSLPAASEPKPPQGAEIPKTAEPNPTSAWGIAVTAIHTAAAGNMIDFRYKVLDAKKAEALFSKKTRPYLIHEKTGKTLSVPRTAKVGPLMSSYHPKQDRIYWMFFGNQTKLVKPGDMVSVVIGDFKAEHLTVQ
ncbi:hypothetical protein [Desulfococcus sp.]|uniref:hypothetical protein n=1 Tax=Desulfococcus sp. TaxID=2025834 RepID=UPI003D0FBCB2